jgi:hypothetical protein
MESGRSLLCSQQPTTGPYTGKGKDKVVPMLNQAQRHEDVWGSGGIAPRILCPRH